MTDSHDSKIRALRDEPASAEAMARMRAGLAARIAEADALAGSESQAAITPISSHPRWRAWVAPVAAALAAGLAIFVFVSPSPRDDHVAATESIEQASDEELAIVLDYELLSDYDVIAQLDLLELLDEMGETNGMDEVTTPYGEGRI